MEMIQSKIPKYNKAFARQVVTKIWDDADMDAKYWLSYTANWFNKAEIEQFARQLGCVCIDIVSFSLISFLATIVSH